MVRVEMQSVLHDEALFVLIRLQRCSPGASLLESQTAIVVEKSTCTMNGS